MTDHKTATREEWLAARLELLEAEKALTRRGDELARRRQELPWVRIDKLYRFQTDEGRLLVPPARRVRRPSKDRGNPLTGKGSQRGSHRYR
jgi:hypothetical protein